MTQTSRAGRRQPSKTVNLERDISLALVRSFMAKVETAPDGCWLWTAGIYPTNGYGYFRNRKAHRVSFELFVGPIPEGLTIDHACHSLDTACPGGHCSHRLCVRPDHLRLMSRMDNYRAGRLGSGALKGTGRVGRKPAA